VSEKHRRFFNDLAETWDGMHEVDEDRIRVILACLDVMPGHRVLDLGSGTGVLIPFLLDLAGSDGEITAVDVAERMLEVARRKCEAPNVRFVRADARHLPFGAESFDRVVCYSTFPHFADKGQAMQEIARVTRRGGLVLVAHAETRDAINRLHSQIGGAVEHDALPPDGEMERLLLGAGLRPVRVGDSEETYLALGEKL